jgi:hypothetical protein
MSRNWSRFVFTSVLIAVVALAIIPRALQAQAPTDGISPSLLLAKANAGDAVFQESLGEASAPPLSDDTVDNVPAGKTLSCGKG